MGYDAYAHHILGIPVRRDQFMSLEASIINRCENGHVHTLPLPKFCPECGKKVHVSESRNVPTQAVANWLAAKGKKPAGMAPEDIWEELATDHWSTGKYGIINANPHSSSEDDSEKTLVFGQCLGSLGTEGHSKGQTGLTLAEILDAAQKIEAEAAKLGITGEVKLYLQFYESV